MNLVLDTLLDQLDLFKIAAIVAAAVWSWARVKAEKELDINDKILRSLEYGVQQAWELYVREKKAEGRKLSKQERKEAKNVAKRLATEAASAQGVDLEAELGGQKGLEAEIENVVRLQKAL